MKMNPTEKDRQILKVQKGLVSVSRVFKRESTQPKIIIK